MTKIVTLQFKTIPKLAQITQNKEIVHQKVIGTSIICSKCDIEFGIVYKIVSNFMKPATDWLQLNLFFNQLQPVPELHRTKTASSDTTTEANLKYKVAIQLADFA